MPNRNEKHNFNNKGRSHMRERNGRWVSDIAITPSKRKSERAPDTKIDTRVMLQRSAIDDALERKREQQSLMDFPDDYF